MIAFGFAAVVVGGLHSWLMGDATYGAPWVIGALSVVISGAVLTLTSSIVGAVSSLTEVTRMGEDTVIEQIKSIVESDLMRIGKEVDELHLASVRKLLLGECEIALKELANTDWHNNPAVVIQALNTEIGHMKKGRYAEILAVCGYKDYEHENTKQYYDENYKKADVESVQVKRIFIRPPNNEDFEDAEVEVIREHIRRPNVQALVISWEASEDYRELYGIPPGFGFAILGNLVIVHWGLEKNTRGKTLRSSLAVAAYRKIFDCFWTYALGKDEDQEQEIWTDILHTKDAIVRIAPTQSDTPSP